MFVIYISFEIKLISAHISSCGRLFLLLLPKTFIFYLLLIEITNIVASSLRSMIAPVPHADPTEVVLAICALHVITSSVLFYWAFAAGTGLRMRLEPKIVGSI